MSTGCILHHLIFSTLNAPILNKKLKEFCSEVIEYFKTETNFIKTGNKDCHVKLLQLRSTVPVTAERLFMDLHEGVKAKTQETTIDELLPRLDLVNLIFTRSLDQQRHLSMSRINLIKRCDQLNVPHIILIQLEQEGLIKKIPNTHHYQKG